MRTAPVEQRPWSKRLREWFSRLFGVFLSIAPWLTPIAMWSGFLWAVWYWLLQPKFSSFQLAEGRTEFFGIEQAGQIGDSFGTLNALFTALAAVAAFKAYRSQLQQIRDQQKEFASQRHESHLFFLMEELRQAVRGVTFVDRVLQPIQGVQGEELGGQRAICHLENLLLGKLDSNKAEVPLTRKSPSHGRGVAFIAKERFALWEDIIDRAPQGNGPQARLETEQKKSGIPSQTNLNTQLLLKREVVCHAFNEFYENCAVATLGNVFRLQGAILRYIDTPSIPDTQRKQHAELFKAQVTDPELHLLLYYALSDLAGGDDLRKIMVRYNILEALWRKKPEFTWHRIPEISYFETEASPS